MQKKLIALAVAGLMSGAAFAQSNVTVYGVIDAGYTNFSGSETNQKSRSGIDSSQQASSRLGFRGTEDLGGGLTAGFTYEFGLLNDRADTLTSTAVNSAVAGTPTLTSRVQILTLSSKDAGTLILGRLVNPARGLVIAQDPFGGNGVGSAQNIQTQTTWGDNMLAYASPKFGGGFDVTVGYTHSLAGNEAQIANGLQNTNTRGWVLVPKYAAGPVSVGLSYETFNADQTAGNQNLSLRRWNLAGSYDFGVVKIGATWGSHKQNLDAVTGSDKRNQWMLSAWVPVGANGTVLASYNNINRKVTNAADRKANQWALGYNHAMSKRTNIYTTYSRIATNTAANGQYTVANQSGTFAGYTRGLNIGMRHNF